MSKELEALSAMTADSARAAEAEKSLRDVQQRASLEDRHRRESLKLEEDKRMLIEKAAAEKSRELKQLLEDREKYRRKIEEEEAEEKRQVAIAINAERLQREAEQIMMEKAQRLKIEEEEAEEKRQVAVAINAERVRRETEQIMMENAQRLRVEEAEAEAEEKRQVAVAINAERVRRETEQIMMEKVQRENNAVLDEIIAEKARKADAQRLKREAFLNDTNAFSETIEQEAARASRERPLSANGTVCEQYKIQSVRFSDEQSLHSYQPLAPPSDSSTDWDEDLRRSDADTSHSFKELTSSLLAANSASTERNIDRGNRSDIWGDRKDYPNVNSAANVTAQRAESYRREQDHEYASNERQGARSRVSETAQAQTDEEEEEEGMGGATSISNILTIDERRELSVEQKVAWRALQADLTTRRKGKTVSSARCALCLSPILSCIVCLAYHLQTTLCVFDGWCPLNRIATTSYIDVAWVSS